MLEGGTVGAYRIVRKLGQGGMGTVYLGEHTLLERKAAIKVLLPALCADQDIVQRFFNEARAVTRIADAGIVQVFDFGLHTDGSAFIVMELLEGEPMDRRLERIGRFGVMECLRLLQQICTSLGVVHAKGVVHRDLKPENIFLVGDAVVPGGERTKVLDFGIAKLSGANDMSVMKTQTGTMIGTPVYMSPEQCRGIGDIDHRADIYTIGCVMCTMLTGAPPFDYRAPGELVASHLLEAPPLLASRVPELPEVIEQIAQKCLRKDAGERYQSMAELVQALAAAEETMLPSTAAATSLGLPHYLPSNSEIDLRFHEAFGAQTPLPVAPRRRWALAAIGGGALGIAALGIAMLRGGASAQGAKPAAPAMNPPAPVVVPTSPPPAPVSAPPPSPETPARTPPPAATAKSPTMVKHPRGGVHGSGSTAGSAAFDRSD